MVRLDVPDMARPPAEKGVGPFIMNPKGGRPWVRG